MKFICILFLLITNCASITKSNLERYNFNKLWKPILNTLNTDFKEDKKTSHTLSTDLFKTYQQEIDRISDEWNQTNQSEDSDDFSRIENEFFYDKILPLNQFTISLYKEPLSPTLSPQSVAREKAQNILNKIESNSITSTKNIYDYQNGNQIGFCFARALLTHYNLLKAGIAQNKLLKIFVFGDLFVHKQFWNFHVAILINDDANGYIVADPLLAHVKRIDEWIEIMNQYEIKYPFPRTRFYITDPRKFLPGSGMYDIESLRNEHLVKYFYDLAIYLKTSSTASTSSNEL